MAHIHSLRSHLTVLQTSASHFPSLPAFYVPQSFSESGDVASWEPVSYIQFLLDVELFARHWGHVLRHDGVPPRSVIGMWLSGMTYVDVLHIYGLTRAGYIPQLFSIRLPNPDVVYELLGKANACALLVDPSFEGLLKHCPVPTHHAATTISDINSHDAPLPTLLKLKEDDIVFIFHTSGSTSGTPKLVPCSLSWLDSTITKSHQIAKPVSRTERNQDVTVWMGSMCHIAQSFMLLGSLQHGTCTVQPSKQAFSSNELLLMIRDCGVNRLNQFATFLTHHLRHSRQTPKLLALMQTLDDALYSGLALPQEEEEWAHANGIKLRNLFGSTECAAMLVSTGDSDMYLQPLDGMSYAFLPIAETETETETETPSEEQSASLLELVILAESPDCPASSLRAADGHFHTGDLFQEVRPGYYISKGRDDDWIKSENSLRCDTKAIEDNVRATCGDLVSECVVVGNGRPSPALFIETNSDMPQLKLKREILRRTRQFHSRRYLHERISSADVIVVVEKGSLPRTATKGNVRRRATEEAFRTLLDKIYNAEWTGTS
ncbi:acetyl-CoA synthetase-like protein [Russula earlei]|uniref:Acetyl-CoA synthetase-like protein n=1 Tax=Russula earlei TaxID=71964 RepID=A0ACC0U1G7_9AGAM|nr:acetyl-CoA synthetase-like protein [Russula earlei]